MTKPKTNISSLQDHCVINLTSLEKQSRPGHVRGYLRIQKFSEDPELCPIQALSVYFTKVSFLLWSTTRSNLI